MSAGGEDWALSSSRYFIQELLNISGGRQSLGELTNYKSVKNGANGIRTHDLLHAMQALSQLSYGPRTI